MQGKLCILARRQFIKPMSTWRRSRDSSRPAPEKPARQTPSGPRDARSGSSRWAAVGPRTPMGTRSRFVWRAAESAGMRQGTPRKIGGRKRVPQWLLGSRWRIRALRGRWGSSCPGIRCRSRRKPAAASTPQGAPSSGAHTGAGACDTGATQSQPAKAILREAY